MENFESQRFSYPQAIQRYYSGTFMVKWLQLEFSISVIDVMVFQLFSPKIWRKNCRSLYVQTFFLQKCNNYIF
jgi:hypothetical protein